MNEEKGASLHEQLMAGLAPGDDTPEPETETPEGEEAAEDEIPEGDEPEGDENVEEEAPEGEEEPEGDEGAEGDEAEEEAEGEEGAEPAVKDPINDPLPRGTLETTRKRFEHVVGALKEQTTRAEKAEGDLDEIVGRIRDSGMDADKYQVMLEYAGGVNSGDPERMRASYNILMTELKGLATALGEPFMGVNPLQGHADLMAAVEKKEITQELALETAINRNRQAAANKLLEAKRNNQSSGAAQQAAEKRAAADFTAIGKQLAVKDGTAEYQRKAGLVISMFKDAIMALPPDKRVAAFKRAYDNVPAAAAKAPAKASAAKPGAAPAKKGATPLRGNKRPSGNSTTKAPKSMAEALRQGLLGGD